MQEDIPRWYPWRSLTLSSFLALLLFEVGSGAYLYLAVDSLDKAAMIMLLLHFLLGVVATIPVLIFLPRHLKTTVDREVLQSGIDRLLRNGAAVLLIVSLATGLWLFFVGLAFGTRLVWTGHVAASYLAVLLLAVHIAYKYLVGRRKLLLRAAARSALRRVVIVCAMVFVLALGAAAVVRYGTVTRPSDYDLLREEHLFEPSLMTATFAGLGRTEAFTHSKSCGLSGCHEGIYREWQETPHGAGADAAFMSVVQSLQKEVGGKFPSRLCGGCHLPVSTITGNLDVDNDASPDSAAARHRSDEGISCIFCHSIQEVRRADGGSNIICEPREFVLTNGENSFLNYVYKKAVAMKPEAHGRSYTRPFYSQSKACVACHARKQFDSWMSSPYHDAQEPSKSKECQDCHMPGIPLQDEIITRRRGEAASHRFPGANVTLPHLQGHPVQEEVTRRFIADRKILLNVATLPSTTPGAALPVVVSVLNDGVGHMYPSGPDIDLTEAWLEVRVHDAKGRVIHEEGLLDSKQRLGKDAYVYTEVPFDVFLNPVSARYGHRHQSWHFHYLMTHVIPPKHVDDVRFTVPVPASAAPGRLRVSVALRHRRPSQAYLDWVSPGKTAPVMEVAQAQAETTVASHSSGVKTIVPGFAAYPRCAPYYLLEPAPRPSFMRDVVEQSLVDFRKGETAKAVEKLLDLRETYGAALGGSPESMYDIEVALGEMLHRMGRDAEAAEHARSVLQSRPDPFGAVRVLIEIYQAQNRPDLLEEMRAMAAKIEDAARNKHFETARYRPWPGRKGSTDELRRRIDRGDYESSFSYRLKNEDFLLPGVHRGSIRIYGEQQQPETR